MYQIMSEIVFNIKKIKEQFYKGIIRKSWSFCNIPCMVKKLESQLSYIFICYDHIIS